jgi:hypothetical protein
MAPYLLGRNGLLAGLAELLDCLLVVAKILLAADQEYRDVTAEVKDLGVPLLRLSACEIVANPRIAGCTEARGVQQGRADLLRNVVQ